MTPLRAIVDKVLPGLSRTRVRESFDLGESEKAFAMRLEILEADGYGRRLWAKDSTLWAPASTPDIANRLGWLDLPELMRPRLPGIRAFAETARAEGFRFAVVLGMGGSSLTPDVLAATFGSEPGYPELIVLDSTHPAAVAAVERRIDLARTMFIVSSKSGTTIEPLSFFRYFWSRACAASDTPEHQFIAITDPGTPLLALARQRRFRLVFEAPPDVGGRYSALTEFGLVPAALIGMDLDKFLEQGRDAAAENAAGVEAAKAPGLKLGAAIGEAAMAGRDKLTFLASPLLRAFPAWLEQLVAESTGKSGRGIVPVADEPAASPASYGRDRIFVSLALEGEDHAEVESAAAALERAGQPVIRFRLSGPYALGRAIFDWEVGIAAAGSVLGIHPFNQPDVELAKELARQAMGRGPAHFGGPLGTEDAIAVDDAEAMKAGLGSWLPLRRPGDYVAIQAYLAPGEGMTAGLQELRRAFLEKTNLATTLGYGPRFLHSTGQLHKGGPDEVMVLQLVDEPLRDIAVPDTDFTFGTLIKAQALGDCQALRQRGRRVLRVNLKDRPEAGIARLRDLVAA